MLWVSQPWRPWITVFLKPYLAEVMPWVLSQDSFKTIVRPQIHRAGFQHRQFKHEHIRQENTRRIWSEIAGHDSLIYRFASSFTACDCHHTGLAKSFWTLVVQVVLAAVQQNGLALEKVRWRFFLRGHVDRFPVILPWLKDGCPNLNRHPMPFEMTRRCVNLDTEGNLLDLTGEVGNERGFPLKALRRILEDASFTQDLSWNEVLFWTFLCDSWKIFFGDLWC